MVTAEQAAAGVLFLLISVFSCKSNADEQIGPMYANNLKIEIWPKIVFIRNRELAPYCPIG